MQDEYDFYRKSSVRFTGIEMARPTGRIFNDIFYEAQLTSSEYLMDEGNVAGMCIRPRLLMGFGVSAIPSYKWFKKYYNQIDFIVGYLDGTRSSPVVLGYLRRKNTETAEANKFGDVSKFGDLENSLEFNDDDGTAKLSSDEVINLATKKLSIISSETSNIKGENYSGLYHGSDDIGVHATDGKVKLAKKNDTNLGSAVTHQELKSFLGNLIDTIALITVPTVAGPATPINPASSTAIKALKTQLDSFKSSLVELK